MNHMNSMSMKMQAKPHPYPQPIVTLIILATLSWLIGGAAMTMAEPILSSLTEPSVTEPSVTEPSVTESSVTVSSTTSSSTTTKTATDLDKPELMDAKLKGAGLSSDYLNKVRFRKTLRFNPFVVPDYVDNKRDAASSNLTESDMELRAVLVGGEGSLVNVNGIILGVGQDINGYVLKSVYDDRAVFIKREKEFVLPINKNNLGLKTQ